LDELIFTLSIEIDLSNKQKSEEDVKNINTLLGIRKYNKIFYDTIDPNTNKENQNISAFSNRLVLYKKLHVLCTYTVSESSDKSSDASIRTMLYYDV